MINRTDGIADKDLKATIYTWRDPARNLVGFVYRWWESDNASIVYFSIDPGSSLKIRMHQTKTIFVNDPDMVSGERLASGPDLETDKVVKTMSLKETDIH